VFFLQQAATPLDALEIQRELLTLWFLIVDPRKYTDTHIPQKIVHSIWYSFALLLLMLSFYMIVVHWFACIW
jgi:hypothetical protein